MIRTDSDMGDLDSFRLQWALCLLGGIRNQEQALEVEPGFAYLNEDPVPVLAFIGIRGGRVDGLLDHRDFLRLGLFYLCLLRDQGAQPDDGEVLHQPTLSSP